MARTIIALLVSLRVIIIVAGVQPAFIHFPVNHARVVPNRDSVVQNHYECFKIKEWYRKRDVEIFERHSLTRNRRVGGFKKFHRVILLIILVRYLSLIRLIFLCLYRIIIRRVAKLSNFCLFIVRELPRTCTTVKTKYFRESFLFKSQSSIVSRIRIEECRVTNRFSTHLRENLQFGILNQAARVQNGGNFNRVCVCVCVY